MPVSVPTAASGHHVESGVPPVPSASWLADVHRVALVKAADDAGHGRLVEEAHLLALAGAQAQVKGQAMAGALRDIAVGAIRECLERSEDPAEDASWLMSVATVNARLRMGEL